MRLQYRNSKLTCRVNILQRCLVFTKNNCYCCCWLYFDVYCSSSSSSWGGGGYRCLLFGLGGCLLRWGGYLYSRTSTTRYQRNVSRFFICFSLVFFGILLTLCTQKSILSFFFIFLLLVILLCLWLKFDTDSGREDVRISSHLVRLCGWLSVCLYLCH